jgi:sugar transferase (PEP-CTERM/EpsH1 system associated)
LDPAVFEQIVCTVTLSPPTDPKTGSRVVSVGRSGGGREVLVGKLKRVFDRERPHIVHSRNWGAIEAIVAARMAGVRTVIHSEHGLESSTYRHQPWRRKVMRRVCFTWADRVFAVSHALRDYYVRQLRVREDRIGVVPNGVDTERFRLQMDVRHSARQKLGVVPDTIVVGTVGRLDPIKDHRTLFLAMDLLLAFGVPVQLVVVGDGPERKALEIDIRARNLLAGRTVFVGETSDIVSQLNSFDIFVLPSMAEGMSNALLEAMSVGVASVATRVGGNLELVEEGSSGLLFEAGDAKALAIHLKSLATNPEYRQDLGGNARRRIEDCFSLHRMLSNYTHLYEEAMGNRHGNRTPLNYMPAARTQHE